MNSHTITSSCLLFLAGCGAPAEIGPQRTAFELEGVAYEWALAHGRRGSLMLLRMDTAGHGLPVVVLTCDDRTRGGLQIRDPGASEGEVSLTAGVATYRVDARRQEGFDIPTFAGNGAFPTDWFEAVGQAERVRFSFGGEIRDVPGPGEAAVKNLEDYCGELAGHRDA